MSIEKKETDLIELERTDIISFMSIWDEEIGPEVIDIYPRANIGDPEKLAIHIFTVYQFFWDSPDQDFQKTNITLPINKINRKARIIFNVIPNQKVRGGFQPFIVVFLFPDYFNEEQLNDYNVIMGTIASAFIKKKGGEIFLKDYYQEILKIFDSQISLMEEDKVDIGDYYSYTAAMEDFQAGVKLFQTKNFDQAFETLKKVLFKFEQEENKNLIMEVLYIMASMFTQQKKFKKAGEYFKRLRKLAEELQHDKYLETSTFMEGFCEYKNENLSSARKKFEKLEISKTKFINKLQYFTIFGRILANQEKFEEAKQNLLKALELSGESAKTDIALKQQSQILYDLGVINYKIAINGLKSSGIKKEGEHLILLKEAIKCFDKAIEMLRQIDDFNTLFLIFHIVGNIYEFLEEDLNALKYYEDALDYAVKGNNPSKEIIVLNRIIQKQSKLGMHEQIIKRINEFLLKVDDYRFMDLYSVSTFHRQLAKSLIIVDKTEEGLSHLIKAYEIVKSFKNPVFEEVDLLNQIIGIFKEQNNEEKVTIYSEELKNASNKLKEIEQQKPKTFRPLGEIREIWVFHSTAGVELYNYAFESQIDHDLLGGFLTALRQFSMEVSQKQLEDMVIGNDCFMIYQEEGYSFYMLGRADAKVSKEIMSNILSKVYNRFWKEYSQHIIDFVGNVKYFRGFTSIIESLDLTLTR